MNYSSVEFLLALPVFCATFWLARGLRSRLLALLCASALFYAYGDPVDLAYLAAVIALAYSAGLLMSALPQWRGVIVGATVTLLLGALAFFKYAAFVAALVGRSVEGVGPPLGISFFTFEVIAYVVDLKRRIVSTERSWLRLALFVGVFPHLISGPIMRPNDLIPQLRREIRWRLPTFVSGLQLFVEGLAKKRLIADPAGRIVDAVFQDPASAGTPAAWLAALAYTLQIYGDFAGYTDMGRGVARMIGLELPINFDAPYAARSIGEFWRRWHISLSSWLRDYLYIPLGGNRRSASRTYSNLFVTMLLGGLWHGAGLTFLIWGAYHGISLAVERSWAPRVDLHRWVAWSVTLFLVVNGWVIFRSQSLPTMVAMFDALYRPRSGMSLPMRDAIFVVAASALVIGAMLARVQFPTSFERIRTLPTWGGVGYGALAALTFLVVISGANSTRPFIYFRF